MRKLFLLTITAVLSLGLFAQETFNESFDSGTFPPKGWSMSQNYPDYPSGYKDWKNGDMFTEKVALSWLMFYKTPAWLVTPRLTPTEDNCTLKLKYKGAASTTDLKVKVSLESPEMTDANFSKEIESVFQDFDYSKYQEATIDLSAFKGEKIYIAFINTSTNKIILDDFTSTIPLYVPEKDASIEAILNKDLEVCGQHNIQVQLKNNGKNELTACDINYIINDKDKKTFKWTGSLAQGATADVTIAENYDFSEEGEYKIEVTVKLEGDENSANNTLSKTLTFYKFYQPSFNEGFELGKATNGWILNGVKRKYSSETMASRNGNRLLRCYNGNKTIFTKAISVNKDEEYTFSIWYKTTQKGYNNITVSYGKDQAETNLTEIVKVENATSNDNYTELTGTFTPTEAGNIFICIKVGDKVSEDATYLGLDDMSVKGANSTMKHLLLFGANNEKGGTVTATVDGNPIESGVELEEGTEVILTATPKDANWKFAKWIVNGEESSVNYVKYTIEGIDKESIVVAVFETEYTVEFSVVNNKYGNLTAKIKDGDAINSGDKVKSNTEVVFTATPEDGAVIKEWVIGTKPYWKQPTELTQTIDADTKITVEFAKPHAITLADIEKGKLSIFDDLTSAIEGQKISVRATPDDFSYKLKYLKVYKTDDEATTITTKLNQYGSYDFIMPDYDVTITAEFELPGAHKVAIDPNLQNGTITSDVTEQKATKYVFLTIKPEVGFQIKEGTLKYYKTDETSTETPIIGKSFQMPDYDITITAEFEEIPAHSITTATVEHGTLESSVATAKAGTEVSITATPEDGYQLKIGSLKVYKTDDEATTVIVAANKFEMPNYDVTITAEFEELPAHNITTANVEHGTLSSSVATAKAGTNITITVTPENGYKLKENSLKVYKTDDENKTTIVVMNEFTMPDYDVTITAEFEEAVESDITVATVDNGTLSASATKAFEGTEVTITVNPADGFQLKEGTLKVYKTDEEAITVNVTDNKFVMPAYAVTITAEFEAIPVTEYEISVATVDNGTLGASVTKAAEGTEVEITVTPADGFQLKEGSLKVFKTDEEATTVTVTDNKFVMPAYAVTITAEFTKTAVGINDEMEITYQVMPNPFTNQLVLKGIANAKEVNIYSVTGTLVYSNSNIVTNEITINTNNLKQGVYFVKVTNKQGKSSFEKVIKK